MRRFALVLLLFPLLAGCAPGASDDGAVEVINPSLRVGATATPPRATIAQPELLLSTPNVYQGGAVRASLVGEVTGGAITFLGRSFVLTQGSESMYAFVPVDASDAAGTYPLRARYTTNNGSEGEVSAQVTVLSTSWATDAITVPQAKLRLLDPRVSNDELAILSGVYGQVTPAKLWSGAWQVPVEGAITTRFGERRSYNGGPVDTQHTGTDIAAPDGTPVVAPNSGRVVMVRKLQVRGNMVIIDHGGGLFSGYAHLGAFAVAEGQEVKAGDVLGYVGNTGLSTGAHLHWEMSAGGISLDAIRFADGTNGF